MSDFGLRLAQVARGEHQAFAGIHETDARLRKRILETYLPDLKAADPSDPLGWNQSRNVSSWAWSATFVSWCVLKAGAPPDRFDFSIRHAVFIQKAIRSADTGGEMFRAARIDDLAPAIGDLICNNRSGGRIGYDDARDLDSYNSHSAVVVEFVEHGGKRYAVTVGGNESDSIRRTEVELRPDGRVRQRSSDPFICIIRTSSGVGGALDADRSARSSIRTLDGGAGLAASFRGHGTFVYDATATIGEYGTALNVAKAMKRAGMRHAWVRVFGRQPFDAAQKASTSKLIDTLRDEGLAVAGWGWCQGEDARAEARAGLRELDRFGVEDFVADIEPGHNNAQWSVTEIERFCETVKGSLKGSFAISSFALIDWHEPHLMRASLPFVDAFAPQVYWFNYPNARMVRDFKRPDGSDYARNDPGAYADLCLDRWQALAATDPKPLILTGQAYWGEGSFDRAEAEGKLRDFLDGWKGHGRLAGLNWWHFGGGSGMSRAMLEAIVEADLDARIGTG